ncbi:MAG: cytosine permease [Kineosporiaceae bacterium]
MGANLNSGTTSDPGLDTLVADPPPTAAARRGGLLAVPDDEAPATLEGQAPRSLGLLDQLGLWGNLGVSLLGFTGAIVVLAPAGAQPMSVPAALTALVVGSVLGALILGTTLLMGARTGAPAMVVLRGVLGGRASYAPTVLNIAQCLGWGVFELVVIAESARALSDDALPRWVCVVGAGALTTLLTLRPLGAIRWLRRLLVPLVVLSLVVLAVGLLRRDTPAVTGGSWGGFWLAVDAVIALSLSWVPLAADYSRHSRTPRAAFAGGAVGYSVAQIACMGLGVVALLQVQLEGDVFALFRTLALGTAALAVLTVRETDQSFANVYSTAVSLQNLAPRLDRRVLTVAIGALITAGALWLKFDSYDDFLYAIGGFFVPLSGVMIAAWVGRRGAWDTSVDAPTRVGMLLAWLAGFVAYQLVNPGSLPGWSGLWTSAGEALHTLGQPWLSASVTSFAVAALIAWPFTRRAAATQG